MGGEQGTQVGGGTCTCTRWEAGDLLVLDNLAVGHGRLGYSPTASRSIVVAITQ